MFQFLLATGLMLQCLVIALFASLAARSCAHDRNRFGAFTGYFVSDVAVLAALAIGVPFL